MTALERIAALLARARVAGGWDDEVIAMAILAELGLDDEGNPIDKVPTSPNIGHG
jgi:hypothetical protein